VERKPQEALVVAETLDQIVEEMVYQEQQTLVVVAEVLLIKHLTLITVVMEVQG
jgi:hypothetical protein